MSEAWPSQKLIAAAIETFEQTPLPDGLTRLVIRGLCSRTMKTMADAPPDATRSFAAAMRAMPVAIHTGAANAQHYEVPAAFFKLVLGPQRKYSCCLYAASSTSLAEAEEAALVESARRAGLADGQDILELGCGWGSLTLWMARNLPNARILAVSNSRTQRLAIEADARAAGLANVTVVTADVNSFAPPAGRRFDRAVSIEMLEHVSNWPELLGRVGRWLKPDGAFFVHVFTHRSTPYRFDHQDASDWIGRHFFTGGIMPSDTLIGEFPEAMRLERSWRWSGTNYERTANDWLANFDANPDAIMALFAHVYGGDAKLWHRRWRLFFLATAGLFGHDGGREWGVGHYLLRPPA